MRNQQIGDYLIAEILYPDAKNYEGKKILIYKSNKYTMDNLYKKLISGKYLDPHFCEGDHLSPVARFVPTEEGWEMAKAFVKSLNDK